MEKETSEKNKPFKILCIDGGGIKGALPAAFLKTIEEKLHVDICDYFDLIVGTSTGGIIALALSLDYPAKEVLDYYQTKGPEIFYSSKPQTIKNLLTYGYKYKNEKLKESLQQFFKDKILRESYTDVLINTFNLSTRNTYTYTNKSHESETAVNVALATSAAPFYFPPFTTNSGVRQIDGGVWANNPVDVAIVEALTVYKQPVDNIKILSVGCTANSYQEETAKKWLNPLNVINLLFDVQSNNSINAKLLNNNNYIRINPVVSPNVFKLDDTSKIDKLVELGVSTAEASIAQLKPIFFTQTTGKNKIPRMLRSR